MSVQKQMNGCSAIRTASAAFPGPGLGLPAGGCPGPRLPGEPEGMDQPGPGGFGLSCCW